MRRILAGLLATVMLVSLLTQAAFAANNGSGNVYTDDLTVTNISMQEQVKEGGTAGALHVVFQINKVNPGDFLHTNDVYEVPTNLGALFDADWSEFRDLPLYDSEQKVLCYVTFHEDKMQVRIADAADMSTDLEGNLVTTGVLTAKEHGATKDQPVEKSLEIGTVSTKVVFLKADPILPSDNPGDMDVLWKNAWSYNNTGSVTAIEVNPIGSMDLYGSTTYAGRRPIIHDKFLVQDTIPEKGFVDEQSVKIYAAVPALAESKEDHEYRGYDLPKGTYYAQRSGTMRYRIDSTAEGGTVRMTKLEQYAEESLTAFKERVQNTSLSWGIYRDTDKTETFLCNFGHIGDPNASTNNGIKYSDFNPTLVEDYPEIFGDEGASGGNIVSYYLEFVSYYPDIVGQKEVVNHADRISYENGSDSPRKSGNDSLPFLIINGTGSATVRKSEVSLTLVDEKNHDLPIGGAEFVLMKQENGVWKKTPFKGMTNEQGTLTFGPLVQGTYQLVQTSAPAGYIFDNTTYLKTGNEEVGTVSTTGIFDVAQSDRFGHGTIVTNRKADVTVAHRFVSKYEDDVLPVGVLDQLPQAYQVPYGETVEIPAELSFENVSTPDGVWTFVGWDRTRIDAVTADATFTGTWEFKRNTLDLNTAPTITAGDRVLTVGDVFDALAGVSAYDAEDGDLTGKITVIHNTVDTAKPGTYEVTYRVEDYQGASTTKTVQVMVQENTVPEQPQKPEQPEANDPKPDTTQPTNPQNPPDTGDRSAVGLWAVLLVVSGGILGILCYKKKNRA